MKTFHVRWSICEEQNNEAERVEKLQHRNEQKCSTRFNRSGATKSGKLEKLSGSRKEKIFASLSFNFFPIVPLEHPHWRPTSFVGHPKATHFVSIVAICSGRRFAVVEWADGNVMRAPSMLKFNAHEALVKLSKAGRRVNHSLV